MSLSKDETEDLKSIYRLILSSPELLIQISGMRQCSIREAYTQVLAEVKKG